MHESACAGYGTSIGRTHALVSYILPHAKVIARGASEGNDAGEGGVKTVVRDVKAVGLDSLVVEVLSGRGKSRGCVCGGVSDRGGVSGECVAAAKRVLEREVFLDVRRP